MDYEQVPRNVRTSIQGSLRKQVKELIKTADMSIDDKSIVFARLAFDEMKKGAAGTLWQEICPDVTISDGDLLPLVQKQLDTMRAYQPTSKQIAYFTGMGEALGLENDIPDDYVLFVRQLTARKAQYEQIKPATEKQLRALQRLWPSVFGIELPVGEFLSQAQAHEMFNTINDAQARFYRESLMRESGDTILSDNVIPFPVRQISS